MMLFLFACCWEDYVECPGYSFAENTYCDCNLDCVKNADTYCGCEDAQECCKGGIIKLIDFRTKCMKYLQTAATFSFSWDISNLESHANDLTGLGRS